MATDFEAEGLLEGVEGEARDARRRLLEGLEEQGVPLDELRAAVQEGRLALLPVERALAPPGPRYTLAEVAERSGLDLDFLTGVMRALGLPLPEDDDAQLSDLDVAAARIVAGFRAVGIADEPLLESTRVLGNSLSQFVSATRAVLGEAFVSPGDTEYDIATRWATAAREMNPQLEQLVLFVLHAQQVAQLRQDVIDLSGIARGAQVRTISVAFADLTGFTRLGETVPVSELGQVAGRLTALAVEVVTPPVRLVKMIGDAAMLVSPEPEPLLAAAIDLVEAADEQGEDFPQLRSGIACGEALSRAGDWFGRPVNLASRITDRARAGSVLTAADFREAVGDEGWRWSRLGKRRLKGISGEIELFRARRAAVDGA